ncbi:MAG: VIT1/CCC1 transporter family protein [Alphaproteobacteria bacterium]|nr:VIT1/CCC1 transporter family protein [Alphaproteobacteria bacterium]
MQIYDMLGNIMTRKYSAAAAVVLGMHDALVSLTGMIGGLTFALAERQLIVLTAIIASVAAGLSMAASNYLAEKTNGNPHALRAGTITGAAYLGTCAALILPFIIMSDTYAALIMSFAMAVIIIFGCNFCICRRHGRPFWRHAIEMLIICAGVSIVSFIIGEVAKHTLGVLI